MAQHRLKHATADAIQLPPGVVVRVNQGKKDRWGRDIWHEIEAGTWMVVHAGKLAMYDDQQFHSYFDSPQTDEDEGAMGDNVVVIQQGPQRHRARPPLPPARAWQSPYPIDSQGAPTGPLIPPPPPRRSGGN